MTYACSSCPKHFSTSDHLAAHYVHAHATLGPLRCVLCGKDFADKSQLAAHRRSHISTFHNSPFHVSGMKRAETPFEKGLQKHSRHISEKLKPFDCAFCHRPVFCSNCLLCVNVWKTHHAIGKIYCLAGAWWWWWRGCFWPNVALFLVWYLLTPAIWHRSFESRTEYLSHSISHNGETPYYCEYCQKRFAEKNGQCGTL